MKVEFLSVNDLKPSEWNPVARTTDSALEDVLESMEIHGFWNHHPITVTKDNFIADGHRRWTAAKILGIKKIPCLRTDMDLQTAWAEINATARPIKAKDIFQAYKSGFRGLSHSGVGRRVQRYIDKYGEEMVMYCAQNNLSNSPIIYAERIVRYVGWDESKVPQVVRWIVENRLVRKALIAIDTGYSREKLIKLIETNQTLEFK